jgi:transketolase
MKISDNHRSRWTIFAGFANSTAKRPAIRNIIGCREWKPPLARSDKVSQPVSGMAIAQKWLANRYNKPGFEIFDYAIYAVAGDGCMMEGVASEACLARRSSRSR